MSLIDMNLPDGTVADAAESANISGLPLYVVPRDKLKWKARNGANLKHKI